MKFKIITITEIFLVLIFSSIVSASENVTREMAIQAINESEQIMIQMQENNFSVNYINDTLMQARQVFTQAVYAQILRNEINSTDPEKREATAALVLIKWQNITYADVLVYTENIKTRRDTAYLLLDKISIAENNLDEITSGTKEIFSQAQLAFYEERYNDTEKLLSEFNTAVESEKIASSTLFGLKIGAMNFFQRYWIYIIIFFIFFGVIAYFIDKGLRIKLLKNKIKKKKAEEKVLLDLMKKTQEERFKENKISGLVYNIRMKKYEEKLQEIKQELPVLEENLKKFKNKRDVNKPVKKKI